VFTGLVEGIGEVVALTRANGHGAAIEIASPLAVKLAPGDSVSVNGACLTAVEVEDGSFRADVVDETLRRTTLGELAAGSHVNLELPLRADGRLGGHIVLGHVDGVGTVVARNESGEIDVEVDAELGRYVVEKGSIALDGVSLTVAALDGDRLTVALIPATLEATTLGDAAPGRRLNVEVDILAKHVERLVAR